MKRYTSLILILSFTALLLCACGEAPAAAPVESLAPVETQSPVENVSPVETVTPAETPASSAAPAYTVIPALEESGSYTDSLGNVYEYSYRIPAICSAVSFSDVSSLNSTIYEQLMQTVSSERNSMDSGVSLTCAVLDYESYVNGSVISIVCTADMPNDFISYWVYNFDTASGQEFTPANFAAAAGITEDALYALASAACGNAFTETYGQLPHDSFYEEQYAKTIDSENLVAEAMFFYDENGTLSVAAPVYSLAGASFYYRELPIV